MKRFLYVCILLFLASVSHSQTDSSVQYAPEETIQSILENSTDEENTQLLLEELEYYRDHPLRLSTASYSELIALPFISPNIAVKILLLRDTVALTSFEQLRVIPEISDELLKKISLFSVITNETIVSKLYRFAPEKIDFRSRLEKRLQNAKGFDTGKFLGNKNYLYQRIKLTSENYEVGLLGEKDAGETNNEKFVIGAVTLKNVEIVKQFTVGTYNLHFGEALAVGKNLSSAFGYDATGQIKKRGKMLRPSLSTDEFRYFQGIASEIQFDNISLVPYYSKRKLSGIFDSSANAISSFYTSGLFRTENDIQKKNLLGEKFYGTALQATLDSRQTVGGNYGIVEYNRPLTQMLLNLQPAQRIPIANMWTALNFSQFSFFGETATNYFEKFSFIVGTTINPTKNFSFAFLHRKYSQEFTSPFSSPLSARSKISDGETGNYFGAEFRPMRAVYLSGCIDAYILNGKNSFDTQGNDALLYAKVDVTKKLDIELQLRRKIKSQVEIRNLDDERNQTNIRFGYTYKILNSLMFSQRFEQVTVQYFPSAYSEKGFLIFAELMSRHATIPYFFKARLVIFNTNSYDSRLYQYESDVAGNYSNPPMYGKGMRWYVVSGYEVFENFLLSCKYCETNRYGVDVIGSGDDEIKGNFDNYFVLQLDFTF